MKTKTDFIALSYDCFDYEEKNYIKVYGRSSSNKRVCIIDSFQPHIWAILEPKLEKKEVDKIIEKVKEIKIISERRITKIEKIELENKNYLGKEVQALKIFVTNYKDARAIADCLTMDGIEKRREHDIHIITKYITDRKIVPLKWHSVEGEILDSQELGFLNLDADLVIKPEKISKIEDNQFIPKVIAFDIETEELEIGKGEILMISIYSDKLKKVLTWKRCSQAQNYVECFKDEADMIEAFIKYIRQESPDIITGYFSDGFDLAYLRARAEKNNLKLELGFDGSQPSFSRGVIPTGKIEGLIHIDLFRFIDANYSQYLQSETLGLNEVASELIGEGKQEFEIKHSKHLKENDWKDYFSYNLQDSMLTYKLFEKFWPDMQEISKMLQEPIFNISRDRMSQHVEDYLFHNLERFNEIAEKQPNHEEIAKRRTREKYEGAFVFQPIPGLYKDIGAFDFTSMYGSIINSFNLSLANLTEEKKDSNEVDIGTKRFYFSKKATFFPMLIGELIERRKQLKKQLKENPSPILKARSNAAKLLVNASYGYLGFFGARYYCPEAAASTTALVRKFIHEMIDKTNKEGYKVVYADTDSLFFLMNNKTQSNTLEFLKKLNNSLPGSMELELEDFYKRGLWVTKRTGKFGAKKKYALIDEKNKIKIRGFETVRRDWCNLARELQSQILELILREGNEIKALELVKKAVKDLKERKISREQIMIKSQLKKPINEYKSITPHVIVAKKMHELGIPLDIGMPLEYFIAETREKKALVREKVKLADEKGEYNLEYYLKHQILPAVENIFEVFGINVNELIDGKKQTKLSGF